MRSCTILFPGLLGPDVPVQELPRRDWPDKSQLPNLLRILQRGQVSALPDSCYEQRVLEQLGIVVSADAELPVAQLRANAARADETDLWCLDPAYVELDREGATLTALDSLDLSSSEAVQLIDSINRHFADTLRVQAHTPQQWQVNLSLQLRTHTPTQVLWRNLGHFLPTGPDAGEWRRLLNELQMLLYEHPVNQARSEQGDLPVNSLWLWGGGKLVRGSVAYERVYANDELVKLSAACNELQSAPLPDKLDSAMFPMQRVLLVMNAHLPGLMRKDVYAWFAALEQLEQAYLQPLLARLNQGELDVVCLLSNTMQISLTRRDLRRWLFRKRELPELVIGLRGKVRD